MNVKSVFLSFFLGGFMLSLSSISIGDKAPGFTLLDQDGNERSLSGFKGSYVVLYFYPKDGTPGCKKEACSLRDSFNEFEKENIIVIGVNYDSPETHKKFKEKNNLPFILLSDKDKKVAKQYGVKNWFFWPFPKRRTFIIDDDGVICLIIKNIDLGGHGQQVIDAALHCRSAKNK